MGRLRTAGAALLLGGVAASGCATLDLAGHQRALEESHKRYVRFLRWGEYDAASRFVDEEVRERFRDEIAGYAEVRFSDYEVVDTQLDDSRERADILVHYRAYHLSRLIEHSWSETQVWERDESGAWRVTPDLDRLRGALAAMAP